MATRSTPPQNCLCGGCDAIGQCTQCGFDRAENERRKKFLLVLGKDGLQKKIIRCHPQFDDELRINTE